MPDLDEDLDETTFDIADDPDGSKAKFVEMRKQANRAKQLDKENQRLAAELAELRLGGVIASAGLGDLNGKQRTALLAAHGDGEMSKDALLATAVEIGLAQPQADPAEEAARQAALDGVDRARAASAGARPPAPASTINEQLAQAQAAGDAKAVAALKAQAALQLLRAGKVVQAGD